LKVRKYSEEDAEEKRRLHLKTIREVNARDYSDKRIGAWTIFDEDNSVEEDTTERWVAEEEGKIVGFADYIPGKARITGIYVHPDFLRQGIGSKLLEKIVKDARRKGIEELRCESSVTAKDFYSENGFEVVKEVVHETSGEELEAFKMKRKL
jgi:putative acetyltransferase